MATRDSEITFRLPDLVDAATLARVEAGAQHLALAAAARIARARWIAIASDRLRGHGRDLAAYVGAIGLPVLEGDHVTIRLAGDVAGRIEGGRPRVDLRDVLLGPRVPLLARGQRGRGKRQNKAGGFYRAIPLPPRGGSAEAAQAPPGAAGDATLGRELAAAARRLSDPMGSGNGADMGVPLAPPGALGATSDPMARLYAATADQAPARAAGADVNFRTISTTRGGGWIIRPRPGAHIMRDVERAMARDIPAAIRKMLAEVRLPGATSGPKG